MRAVQGCPSLPFRVLAADVEPVCSRVRGVSLKNVVNKCSAEGVRIPQ